MSKISRNDKIGILCIIQDSLNHKISLSFVYLKTHNMSPYLRGGDVVIEIYGTKIRIFSGYRRKSIAMGDGERITADHLSEIERFLGI